MAGRPKPPICPGCGKAMYKAPLEAKGKSVKKEWPYAYCRNASCGLFGKNQSLADGNHQSTQSKVLSPATSALPLPEEHPAVKKARRRIGEAIRGKKSVAPNMVGLALTVMAQEIGSFKAANALIDDFGLADLYGIQKIETD